MICYWSTYPLNINVGWKHQLFRSRTLAKFLNIHPGTVGITIAFPTANRTTRLSCQTVGRLSVSGKSFYRTLLSNVLVFTKSFLTVCSCSVEWTPSVVSLHFSEIKMTWIQFQENWSSLWVNKNRLIRPYTGSQKLTHFNLLSSMFSIPTGTRLFVSGMIQNDNIWNHCLGYYNHCISFFH